MSNNNNVYVKKKPVIGILSTGNEIVDIGKQIGKNQIPSGNNLMISSMVKVFGGIPKILPIAKDKTNDIEKILNKRFDLPYGLSTSTLRINATYTLATLRPYFRKNSTNRPTSIEFELYSNLTKSK